MLEPGDAHLYNLAAGDSSVWQPERALLAAVLADAIEVLQTPTKGASTRFQLHRALTERWVRGIEGQGPHFRFNWICAVLGLPAEAIREKALNNGLPNFKQKPSHWR